MDKAGGDHCADKWYNKHYHASDEQIGKYSYRHGHNSSDEEEYTADQVEGANEQGGSPQGDEPAPAAVQLDRHG